MLSSFPYCAVHPIKVVRDILNGQGQLFAGIDILRKICNHPDLVQFGSSYEYEGDGALLPWQRSAKMIVLENLLRLWRGKAVCSSRLISCSYFPCLSQLDQSISVMNTLYYYYYYYLKALFSVLP